MMHVVTIRKYEKLGDFQRLEATMENQNQTAILRNLTWKTAVCYCFPWRLHIIQIAGLELIFVCFKSSNAAC